MNHVNAIRCNDEYQCSHCGKSWDIHEEAPDCKMTLVNVEYNATKILYFGMEVIIPDWTNYLATDSNGEVYAYDNKPIIDGDDWFVGDSTIIHVATVNLHGLNWRETLRKC
ncbi:hypothetical protein NW995_002483 [Salmonella enterica]|nr:hypothetical protein [Salmonella enterica]